MKWQSTITMIERFKAIVAKDIKCFKCYCFDKDFNCSGCHQKLVMPPNTTSNVNCSECNLPEEIAGIKIHYGDFTYDCPNQSVVTGVLGMVLENPNLFFAHLLKAGWKDGVTFTGLKSWLLDNIIEVIVSTLYK